MSADHHLPAPAGLPADEHERYAHYLRLLADVPEAEEFALVAAVLRDVGPAIGRAAVEFHVDLRAAELLRTPELADWAAAMSELLGPDSFGHRRIREWLLRAAVTRGEEWSADDLTSASVWLQLALAESGECPEVLPLLAEAGRSRRIRNIAAARLRRRPDRVRASGPPACNQGRGQDQDQGRGQGQDQGR
ncbi:hypothetical protein [Streptomyces sp. CB03911]|uniref:hypothetical protein n=1 Tax=Streptomyces sp. CB03911 TaxID=1804758 RepID=UPI00093B689D|nr:hypothetical protein [Streptomyces sp. CB03911]OKI30170.1 hypothetical protein A6A07_23030 [Streptomyces sp. CB03911]